jgi:hypothetical protein
MNTFILTQLSAVFPFATLCIHWFCSLILKCLHLNLDFTHRYQTSSIRHNFYYSLEHDVLLFRVRAGASLHTFYSKEFFQTYTFFSWIFLWCQILILLFSRWNKKLTQNFYSWILILTRTRFPAPPTIVKVTFSILSWMNSLYVFLHSFFVFPHSFCICL